MGEGWVWGRVATAGAHLSHAHITDNISQHLKLSGVHYNSNCWDHKSDLLALAGRARGCRSPALGTRCISTGSCTAGGWLADAQVYLEGVEHPPEFAQPYWDHFAGLCMRVTVKGLQTHTWWMSLCTGDTRIESGCL